ncbi:MAG: nucleotidyltransferase domain-containing protein [bacterium]
MNANNNKMNDKWIKKYLYNRIPLKILSFVSMNPGKILSAHEISIKTKSSKGAVNQTLRLLVKLDILYREKRGNVYIYKLNNDNNILKQFKKFENVIALRKLVNLLKPYSYQIILFGSAADGSNSNDSDIDMFIKTEFKSNVEKIMSKSIDKSFNIQSVIQDPLEISASEKDDNVFFEQVKKGIVLWDGKPTYEEI